MSKASQRKLSNKQKNSTPKTTQGPDAQAAATGQAALINNTLANTPNSQLASKPMPQRPIVSKPSLPQRAARKR